MTWEEELRREVEKRYTVGEVFTLDDVYRLKGHFARLHPRNLHVLEKLRQTLQVLRDNGTIEFVDNRGIYRRIK